MVRLKDIAREAGTSVSTASNVLNGKERERRIAPATAERVREAAARLGFQRNELARALRTGHNREVCFFTKSLESGYVLSILQGLMRVCQDRDYSVRIHAYNDDQGLRASVAAMASQRPAGVVCTAMDEDDLGYLKTELRRHRIVLSQVDSVVPGATDLTVVSDDERGAGLAVTHLRELGHRRIVHLAGIRGHYYAIRRCNGYLRAMSEAGLAVHETDIAWEAEESLRATLARWQASREGPTAIVCGSDPLAALAIHELTAMGVRVPDDISVVGFGDLEYARYCTPRLTTVRQPFGAMGAAIGSALLSVVSKAKGTVPPPTPSPASPLVLEVELTIRESTAPTSEAGG